MSKLDIEIVFDNKERTYRGGETVSGTVHVEANKTVKSDGLYLETNWQTHGRGNQYTREGTMEQLTEGEWVAGRRESYRFSFIAPDGPPTYRGHHLNVDHYVKVYADVPWAIDPDQQEEFVLLPGSAAEGDYITAVDEDTERTQSRMASKMIIAGGALALGLGSMCLFPFGLILIPLGLVALFFGLRNSIAEKRLGEVEISCARRVTPDHDLPLTLKFTPRSPLTVNGITAQLTASEVCVSGSGTNTTTHKHTLFDDTYTLCELCQFRPPNTVELDATISVPQTSAFSFDVTSNAIKWEIKIRIDIPRWPDWTRKLAIVVVPPMDKALSQEVSQPVVPVEPSPVAEVLQILEAALPAAPAPLVEEAPPEHTPDPVPPSEGGQDVGPLVEVIRRLLETSRWGDERARVIGEYGVTVFKCVVDIEHITRSYSYDVGEDYRDGRTITGRLAGTEYPISIAFRTASNDTLGALSSGRRYEVDCVLGSWDRLYDRLNVLEA